ncbi:carbohydrate kinase family protein [Acetivibrio mesophilus]|uniref:Carbohydrate kinase n=1 Tax=Acetivibrio mesophilus TaxID=2487273 RepID=A0A4Q0I7F1_9FIRM|nr:carbohydrate kinase [Acetivibrio mesophilus]RXE60336.1 carbohydrate kinase [Acetivibrio mesophilus]HHV30461.1 carbohydrate kinase [Clostridium sp.]
MFDVIAVGELLIDFLPAGINENGLSLFSSNPGGAPANVLAMLAKLGAKTAFVGKVGKDGFGQFLKATLDNAGIDTSNLLMSPSEMTTLAFVHLDEKGDRSFSFYRKHCADVSLDIGELNKNLLHTCRFLHFGAVSLTDEPSRTATLEAARIAKAAGAIISYDPNYRPALWNDEKEAREYMLKAVEYADLVKVSEEELFLLTEGTEFSGAADKLLAIGPSVIFVTSGEKGSYVFTKTCYANHGGYNVKAVDTTGAGDSFVGAMLWQLKDMSLEEISQICKQQWEKLLAFSNAAGAIVTTKKGAIPAMPDLDTINAFVKQGFNEK